MSDFFSGSWIPQLGGALSAIGLALTTGGQPFYGMICSQLGSAIGLLSARQNNKSSEAVGIRTPEVVVQVETPIIKVAQPLMPEPPRGKPK